jgi:hypothetical protein
LDDGSLAPLALENRAGLDEPALATLAQTIARHFTLQDVVRWGAVQTPPRIPVDVVVQDEFNHDVVLPMSDRIHLVYGTT